MTILYSISSSCGPESPDVVGFYDEASGSCQYICIDPKTKKCALIDVVLDFNPARARTSTECADWALDWIEREGLTLEWILDTHPHADHLMAAAYLKEKTGAPNAIGEKVREIAELWRDFYNTPDTFDPEADFDRLFADGDTFRVGEVDVLPLRRKAKSAAFSTRTGTLTRSLVPFGSATVTDRLYVPGLSYV